MDAHPRTCLKCGQSFASTGAGNRICRPCSRLNAKAGRWMTPQLMSSQRGMQHWNGEPIGDGAISDDDLYEFDDGLDDFDDEMDDFDDLGDYCDLDDLDDFDDEIDD